MFLKYFNKVKSLNISVGHSLVKSLFLLFIFIVSCGTTKTIQRNICTVSNTNRPDWIELHNRKIPCENSFCFVGESSGKDKEEEAVDDAENNAFGRLARNISVEVMSSTSVIREKKSYNKDKTYYSIKRSENSVNSELIKIKDWKPKDTYVECESGKYNAYVLIEIPQKEYERIQTELDEQDNLNKLMANGFTVWSFESNLPETINKNKIIGCLSNAFRKKGINLTNEIDFDESKKSPKDILEKYPEHAYFMKIQLKENVQNRQEYGREKYVYIDLSIALYDRKGNMKNVWQTGEKKGAKYSWEAAINDAVFGQIYSKNEYYEGLIEMIMRQLGSEEKCKE